jgi:DMSO/TMAO reductase YedYZ heme-binding membrane subunit
MRYLPPVVLVLVAIAVVGGIAMPFGDPQFFDRAIALEFSFITLAIVILLDVRLTVNRAPLAKLALWACIPLAILVMVGNSLAPPHVELMTTFSKPFNAVLLIIGGYVLQAALIGTTILQFARARQAIFQNQKG